MSLEPQNPTSAPASRTSGGSAIGIVALLFAGVTALSLAFVGGCSEGVFSPANEAAGPEAEAQGEALADDVANDQTEGVANADGSARVAEIGPLNDRLDAIETRLGGMGEPASADRIATLEGELADVREQIEGMGEVGDRLDTFESDLDALKAQSEQQSGRIDAIDGAVEGLRSDVEAMRIPPAPPIEAAEVEPEEADASAPLDEAIQQFQDEDYQGARDALVGMTEDGSDDARVWYYAALANGKATGDWKGETERLVRRAVELEKAGSPSTEEIDAVFEDLGQREFSAWLKFFRGQAGGS